MKKSVLLIALLILTHFSYAQITKPNTKLSPQLQALKDAGGSSNIPVPSASSGNFTIQNPEIIMSKDGSKILVSLIAKSNVEQLKNELRSKGFQVKSSYGGLVGAYIAPKDLYLLDQLSSLQFARPSYKPTIDATVIGQGDAALKADVTRTTFGVNGAGVKIGVLSDSYDYIGGAAASILNDELPGVGNPNGFTTPVQVLLDDGTSDEGRGMMEIIHDIAPGATFAFHTAIGATMADYANGILALAANNCKVIVDDVRYFEEPMFQDGVIAQAVNQVKSQGIPYFASQGNYGFRSFEGNYRAGTVTVPSGGLGTIKAHNFAKPGDPDRYFLPITITNGSVFILQWDNPFKSANPASAGATTDIDLHFFTGSTGTGYIGSANASNIGNDAVELTFANGTGTLYVAIENYEGPDPSYLKLVLRNGSNSTFPVQSPALAGNYAAGTGYGHSNATGAMAIGAAPFNQTPVFGVNPPVIESFSSRGAVPILFDAAGNRLGSPEIRNKPNVTAIDGANTSFFGFNSNIDGGDGLPNFFGTSAAAPHAAAVAALMIEARHGQPLTPDQVKTAMENSCIDMDDPDIGGFQAGFDFRTGYGLLQADLVVGKVVCDFTVSITGAPVAPICAGTTFQLNGTTTNITNWAWAGAGTFNSTISNPTVTGTSALNGVYTYTLTATNTNSCTATATVQVTIFSLPVPNPQYAPICLVGNTLSLSASGGGSYSWKGPNGFSSASAMPAPKKSKAADAGIYSITVTNTNSCTASATVEVYFGAGAISASSNSPVCKGSTINLSASATHGVSYKWTKLGSTKVWTGDNINITNAKTSNAGLYIVWITGDNGCISKEEVLVSVTPCPGTRLASDEAGEIDMKINAYPNPVTNTLTVEVTLKEPSALKLQLFNSIGNESGTWQLNEESTVHKTELNMGELTGGVYLLQAQAGKQKVVKRVVKIQY